MFQAKNGKKFGSAFAGKNYDEKHVGGEESPAHEAKESPVFEAGEQEGAKEGVGEKQEPAQVVAEHGNATSVHVHHDHKNNKHHVVSHHADGHMHTSDHATADEAQNHASQLGAPQEAAPKNEGAAGQENSPESDGFAMPSLGA